MHGGGFRKGKDWDGRQSGSWFGGQWVRYYLPLGSIFIVYMADAFFCDDGGIQLCLSDVGGNGRGGDTGGHDRDRWDSLGNAKKRVEGGNSCGGSGTKAVRYIISDVINLAARILVDALTNDIHVTHPIMNPLVIARRWERVVTPFAIFAKYLALMVWPRILSADYSAPSLMPTSNPFDPLPLAGILVVSLSLLMGWTYRRQSGALLLTMGLFVLSYALVANVLRIGTIMGERLFYLPSVFVLMIVAERCGGGVEIGWMSQGAWKR